MEVRAQKHKPKPGGLTLKNRVLCPWTPFRWQGYLFPFGMSVNFSNIVHMQKKKMKKSHKLIESSYVNRLNILVINNASELS